MRNEIPILIRISLPHRCQMQENNELRKFTSMPTLHISLRISENSDYPAAFQFSGNISRIPFKLYFLFTF